jgi:hypothetical protein
MRVTEEKLIANRFNTQKTTAPGTAGGEKKKTFKICKTIPLCCCATTDLNLANPFKPF